MATNFPLFALKQTAPSPCHTKSKRAFDDLKKKFNGFRWTNSKIKYKYFLIVKKKLQQLKICLIQIW